MRTITVFNHEMFGDIRTITDERGETYFVGNDVAKALGYKKPENAIATHVESEDKTTTLIQGTGSNYKTKVVIINESGLYALVLSSKLPQAKVFKHWVTSEVLPQIRKTGYARNRTHSHYDSEGLMHTCTYLVWTEKGRKFIHRVCKSEEIMIPFLLSVELTDEED